MYKGKSTCRELKRIRKMIAEQNNIPLEDSECHYEGDCAGTCPKCDAEVRFLENALRMSKQLGKVVTLSGIALAISSCNIHSKNTKQEASEDTAAICTNSLVDSLSESETVMVGLIEDQAYFIGGEEAMFQFLKEHIKYPAKAKEDSISGCVFVSFVVEKDGSLSDIRVIRGVHPLLDSEAVRVVREMPKWEPGKYTNTEKPVRQRFVLPIYFKLD